MCCCLRTLFRKRYRCVVAKFMRNFKKTLAEISLQPKIYQCIKIIKFEASYLREIETKFYQFFMQFRPPPAWTTCCRTSFCCRLRRRRTRMSRWLPMPPSLPRERRRTPARSSRRAGTAGAKELLLLLMFLWSF